MAITLIKSGDNFFKVSGVEDSFYKEFCSEDGTFEYNPETILTDNEVYKISNFSTKDYCPKLLKVTFNTIDYDVYTTDLPKEYLVNIADGKYYFQRITPAMLRPTRTLKVLDSNSKYEKTDAGTNIAIHEFSDAMYDKRTDALYFLKLNHIKNFFNGIEILYRNATNAEVENFLNQGFIDMDEGFSSKNVKTNNRKRIALLKDKYDSFSNEQQQDLKKYVHSYEGDLPYENGEFKIKSDQDLKKLLYGIDERYYTTPIENEKRIANSIIKI